LVQLSTIIADLLLLRVGSLGLTHRLDGGLEASLELKSLLSSASGLLLLLLLGDLGGLTLDLTGLSQRSVNLSHGLLKQHYNRTLAHNKTTHS
jgi:hypothetical protein